MGLQIILVAGREDWHNGGLLKVKNMLVNILLVSLKYAYGGGDTKLLPADSSKVEKGV